MYFFSVIIALILCCFVGISAEANERWTMHGRAQGTTYSIIYYATDPVVPQSEIDSIFQVIDRSMSLYRDSSLISLFNRPETTKIRLDTHMKKVVKKSFEIHEDSDGLFDITVKPLVDLWGFGEKGEQGVPDSLCIQQALDYVGQSKTLSLKGDILYKKSQMVSIDLNGIAQGYTVDLLADYLGSKGLISYLVEVGGEIKARGEKPDGTSYHVAINKPFDTNEWGDYIVEVKDKSITTSGSYEKEKFVDGTSVSHHIDPRTGRAFTSKNIAVTVLADTAIEADAWDNVFMGMDAHEAIKLANMLEKIEIYVLYRDEFGFKESFSDGFKHYVKLNKSL